MAEWIKDYAIAAGIGFAVGFSIGVSCFIWAMTSLGF